MPKKTESINQGTKLADPSGTPKPEPTPSEPKILGSPPQRAAQERHNRNERMLSDHPRGNPLQRMHQEQTVNQDKADAKAEHATRAAPRLPSRPDAPTFEPKAHLPGAVVLYVMPDGTDREAIILSVHGDAVNLLARVATSEDESLQRMQYPLVPPGNAGEPGTWREAT